MRDPARAATRLFFERGWAATTLAGVAAEAGTAVETVYSAFGSKSGLLIAAIDVAIVGDDEQTPLVDRADVAARRRGEVLESDWVKAARIITRALVLRRSADGSPPRGIGERRGIKGSLAGL